MTATMFTGSEVEPEPYRGRKSRRQREHEQRILTEMAATHPATTESFTDWARRQPGHGDHGRVKT